LNEINRRFSQEMKPKMKTRTYADFEKRQLNNAFLLAYKTYEYNLDDFAAVHAHFGHDFKKTLDFLKTLRDAVKPDQALKDFKASSTGAK